MHAPPRFVPLRRFLLSVAGFTTLVSTTTLLRTGMVQGLGLGLSFVPLTTIAYAMLAPQ